MIIGSISLASIVSCQQNIEESNTAHQTKPPQSISYDPISEHLRLQGFKVAAGSMDYGDIDADGQDELLIADRKSIKLFENVGGKFSYANTIATIRGDGHWHDSANTDIRLHDIDNDEDLDITILDTQGIAFLYNDGKGNFR